MSRKISINQVIRIVRAPAGHLVVPRRGADTWGRAYTDPPHPVRADSHETAWVSLPSPSRRLTAYPANGIEEVRAGEMALRTWSVGPSVSTTKSITSCLLGQCTS